MNQHLSTVLPAPRRPAVCPQSPQPARHRLRRPSRAGWIVGGIAALTAVLYLWALGSVGYANSYYAAAVRAGSVSWKAFFFGSIDPGSFITVDKPPAALWVMELSARIFGFSSWSMLVPEAAAGVASVLVLHRLVRRWAGDVAAHLAALALALTPVAVVIFRFNDPDALLTLLGLLAAWALWSALETGRTRWLVVAGILTGLAFETKMLQAFLVLPAFIVVYLLAGPPRLARRIGQLAVAAAALVLSAGWWVAIVALWPAASRPWIGSTTDNSILSLIFGYNGLSRIFGQSGPGAGGIGAGAGAAAAGGAGAAAAGGGPTFGGTAGWGRMFNSLVGGQISWFIPLAVAGLAAGLWLTRRGARSDRGRAGWLLWGLWGLGCLAVFSLAKGIFHPYYAVQLAPPVAALAGAGAVALWELGRRHRHSLSWLLPAAVVATTAWAAILLGRTAGYDTWLRPLVIAGGLAGAAGLWIALQVERRGLLLRAAALVATAALLAGPAAYAVTTINAGSTGVNAAAGPSTGGGLDGGFGGPGGAAAGGAAAGKPGGGGLGAGSVSADAGLVAYLEAHQGDATYLVAAFTSMSSSQLIIQSGKPVITIGGFNGSDPTPTLAQFQTMVARGLVRYVLVNGNGGGGPGGGPGSSATGSAISTWVTANGTAVPVTSYGGATSAGTLYDVSSAA